MLRTIRKRPIVGLIDYGMGNLNSVSRALAKAGSSVRNVDSPSLRKDFDALVLPGVGAFSLASKNLKRRKLFAPIKEWIVQGKPFMGICLGYQLLFERSDESADDGAEGFGIFSGTVRRFPKRKGLKVPHIGWNRVHRQNGDEIFRRIRDGAYFYFVHSYFPVPKDKGIVASTTSYGGEFASSVRRGNLFASQFHPEKSGELGLLLLKNFVGGL